MKVLIWLGCIFLYSSAQTMMMSSGQFGGLTAMVLAVILVFIPAPLLCKQYTQWREKRDETEAEVSPSPADMTEETPLLQEAQIETDPVSMEETKSDDADLPEEIQDTDSPSNLVVLDFAPTEEESETEPEAQKDPGKRARWFFPLCGLCCALVVVVCILGCVMAQMQNSISQQEAKVAELATTVDSLQAENSTLESQRSSAAHWVNQLTSERAKLRDENDFWEDHAVIILPDETYHRYDCSRVSDVGSPVICNWELAKSLGFSPCSICKPKYLTLRERLD